MYVQKIFDPCNVTDYNQKSGKRPKLSSKLDQPGKVPCDPIGGKTKNGIIHDTHDLQKWTKETKETSSIKFSFLSRGLHLVRTQNFPKN